MTHADNIEKKLEQLNFKSTAAMREKILSEASQAMEQTIDAGSHKPSVGRIIMKSNITKFAAAIIIIAALTTIYQLTGSIDGAGIAFAEVVEQIRNSRTVTFITEVQMGQQTMRVERAQKEPGLARAVFPGDLILIIDLNQKKSIVINHSKKQYTEKNLENEPTDQTQDLFNQTQDLFKYMRTLPDQANEVLESKEIDGRIVRGFCVTEHDIDATLWIDVQTGDLVRMEGQFPNAPNTRIVGTDFKFDVELDDALFNLTPPDGYSPKEPPKIDRSEINCQDLINLLQWWATHVEGEVFPPSLQPAEFMKIGSELKKEGKVSQSGKTEEEKMQQMRKLTRGIQFAIMMKPENDWHYVGKDVKLGDGKSPVCWYKPTDSQRYRVIYGDLTFEDVAPENLPE